MCGRTDKHADVCLGNLIEAGDLKARSPANWKSKGTSMQMKGRGTSKVDPFDFRAVGEN